jgi:hypothetical protein
MSAEGPTESERRRAALDAGLEDVLRRLPSESRLGVISLTVIAGSEVGDPLLAVDVSATFADGGVRRFAFRSHRWIDGYFEGKGRVDCCRSLLAPPDILPITVGSVIVEQIAPQSIVRGVMCYLRQDADTATPPRRRK